MRRTTILTSAMLVAGLSGAHAQSVSFGPSLGATGSVGVIDMPNALMMPDGQTSWSWLNDSTQRGGALSFQVLPWIEGTARFITLQDWNGPGDNQVERALDLKFRLLREGEIMPELAIGFRDFLSNGPLASEYIVATKHFGETLRISAGVGWGRMGTQDPIGTPFGDRAPQDATAPGIDHMFMGPAALFAGLEWATPVNGLVFKAEYSSDAMLGEQVFGDFAHESPFNFGLEYALGPRLNFGAYYKYGTDFGFRVTLTGNPNQPVTAPDQGRGPLPINPRPAGAAADIAWAADDARRGQVLDGLLTALRSLGVGVHQARLDARVAEVHVSNSSFVNTPKALGRVARQMANDLPPSVEVFRITLVDGSLPVTTLEIRRSDLEAQVERADAGPASFASTRFVDAPERLSGPGVRSFGDEPGFSWSINPNFPINFFGPGGLEVDVTVVGTARYRLNRNLSFNATLSQVITGNVGETPAPPPPGVLPPVRSNFALYDRSGPVLDRLTVDYIFKPAPQLYARVSAGYFEMAYGGVSGELLWKPTNQSWGLGVEVNYARQRAFDDMFGFQDYDALTGHASLYWDTGWNGFEAQVDVGRYLAGDWGATFSLSRAFNNGWRVSGYMTLTEVSFDDFGAGNFDKGISVTIPLAWTLPFESRSRVSVSLGGYGSDAGSRVSVSNRLYPMIRDSDVPDLYDSWGAFWQ